MTAPVVLFVFKRPEHTNSTIKSLAANPEAKDTDLFIFSDGGRNEDEMKDVEEVREIISRVEGFRSVHSVLSDKNKGLARSIIDGVTTLLQDHNEIIVLEDDMEVAPSFLSYMNFNLDAYKDNQQVASVHAYCYPFKEKLPPFFFLRGADCWGWATWKRAWNLFEESGEKLLQELTTKNLKDEFDYYGAASKVRMLKNQIDGKVDSWAIRWDASIFLNNMLTLYPGKSLLKNIGADGGGTHTKSTKIFNVDDFESLPELVKIPVEENSLAQKAFSNFYLRSKRLNPFVRIIFFLKSKNMIPRR
ncbi:MAG: glycosyltransferase family 2 protein [Ignavibacteriales bacterium]|nr:glycosyltransferase family 2 protein [Ignavibacteriales bacterium]